MTATGPPRALNRAAALDGVAIAALMTAALVGFVPAYQGFGFARAAGGGLVVGLAIAWVGAWRAWSALSVAGATVAAYFLAGGAFALPGTAIGGVLPGLGTLRLLGIGAVASWRQFLTATIPLGYFDEVDTVPFLMALVGAVVAGSAAWRATRPAWALAAVAPVLVGVIALGTADSYLPLAQALVIALATLPWLAWRERSATSGGPGGIQHLLSASARRAVTLARTRDTAIVLVAAAAATFAAAGPLSAGLSRDVARAHVAPPLDLREFASPLASFRSIVRDQLESVLFEVEGMPADGRLRLAVMDSYNGTVYNVGAGRGADSGLYDKVGPEFEPGQAAPGKEAEITVSVKEYGQGYTGVWVPSVGFPHSVTFSGPRSEALQGALYFNPEAGGVVNTVGLMSGDSFTVITVIPASPEPNTLATLRLATRELPPVEGAPDAATSVGGRFVGAATQDYERVRGLVDGLTDPERAFFSHGLADEAPSKPGHSAARIGELLQADRMIGDDEQYAVAMALMARQLGIPARVVMGFHRDVGAAAADVWAVTGDDVHAWVEVAFDRAGWVVFDPTPPEDQVPQAQSPRARQEPQPEVLQPPPPPEAPAELPPEPMAGDADEDQKEEEPPPDWGPAIRLVAGIAIPLLVLFTPVVVIVARKHRRRRRRLTAPLASSRVAGGWREIVDYATDLGTSVPGSATRAQSAGKLATSYNAGAVIALAEWADSAVFGGGEPDDAQVAAYWADVATARRQIGAAAGWWRRRRAAASLASLRRRPASRPDPASRQVKER